MCDPTEAKARSPVNFLADWDTDGTRADLFQGEVWTGSLRLVDAWFTPGSRTPQSAWVVDWRHEGGAGLAEQTLIELDGEPALEKKRRTELVQSVCVRIGDQAEPSPAAFGAVSTGLDSIQGLRDRIEAISHALQHAEHPLVEAARIDEEWAELKS